MSLISTPQIAAWHQQTRQTTQGSRDIDHAHQEAQKAIELDLITQAAICPLEALPELQTRLGGFRPEQLQALLKNNFYDPAVLQTAMCVMNSLVYMQPNLPGTLHANERLREWLLNMKRIGADSVAGYALQADLKTAPRTFIVKTAQNPETDDLPHELFVGLFGLNPLRTTKAGPPVYNFAYIYGGFGCSPPIVDPKDKRVVAWCNNETTPVTYVLYENITPAVSFREYVKTCTPEQYLNIYLQTLYALRKAHRVADFSHRDLHDENVMVWDKFPEGPVQIIYETERGTEYLLVDRLAMLIDFGYSHIRYRGRHYGVHYFRDYGIDPEASFPMYDAYKLLLFSMRSLLKANNMPTFQMAARILRFFNAEEAPEVIVQKQDEFFYFLPNVPSLTKLTFDQLIRYIRSQCPCDFIRERPGPERVLGCQGTDPCMSPQTAMAQVGVAPPPKVPTDFFTFYDLYLTFDAAGLATTAKEMQATFDYKAAQPAFVKMFTERRAEWLDEFQQLHVMPLHQHSPQLVFTPEYYRSYRDYVTRTAKVFDLFQWLQFNGQMGAHIAQLYGDAALQTTLLTTLQEMQPYREAFTEPLASIQADIAYLANLREDPVATGAVEAHPELIWYWTGLPTFNYMLGTK